MPAPCPLAPLQLRTCCALPPDPLPTCPAAHMPMCTPDPSARITPLHFCAEGMRTCPPAFVRAHCPAPLQVTDYVHEQQARAHEEAERGMFTAGGVGGGEIRRLGQHCCFALLPPAGALLGWQLGRTWNATQRQQHCRNHAVRGQPGCATNPVHCLLVHTSLYKSFRRHHRGCGADAAGTGAPPQEGVSPAVVRLSSAACLP